MDATKKPLRIPPQFGVYAEKHNLFEMFRVRTQLASTYYGTSRLYLHYNRPEAKARLKQHERHCPVLGRPMLITVELEDKHDCEGLRRTITKWTHRLP